MLGTARPRHVRQWLLFQIPQPIHTSLSLLQLSQPVRFCLLPLCHTAACYEASRAKTHNRIVYQGLHMQHRKREFANNWGKLQWGRNKPAV